MTNNAAIVEALKVLAVKKGCTLAQLCIAWVAALGAHVIPIPGSSCVPLVLPLRPTSICHGPPGLMV